MRRVYLSFLGIGSRREDGTYGYDPARYELGGRPSHRTEFVQAAEIGIHGADQFDEVILVATAKSKGYHFDKLKAELKGLGVQRVSCIEIDEDMSSSGQWQWFKKILEQIQSEDRLTVDLTHGYRAVPIVFSAAINFLQKAKRVVLDAVYYGAYEKDRDLSPIIDMKDFYLIGEWAEGVSRLVEDADARKLASLVKDSPGFQAGNLSDPEGITLLDDLTSRIRNVDMHNVCSIAAETLAALRREAPSSDSIEQTLLRLIEGKYTSLATACPLSGLYDKPYFIGQLAFIDLLLEHKLYMQAFTVMREVVGSIGLIGNPKAKTTSSNGRGERAKAEVFINMLQYDESKWDFKDDAERKKQGLMAHYEKLKRAGVKQIIDGFLKELILYRNGFDHGWTSKAECRHGIQERGSFFQSQLKLAISELEAQGILR